MSLDNDLVRRVRHRLGDAGVAPSQHQVIDAVRAEPGHAVLGDATLLRLGGRVYDEIAGSGPLTELLADPSVTDITVNGPGEVWVDRGAGMERAAVGFADAASLRTFAQRLAAACDRRLDDASPFVDARLPDGTRVHAVLPPIAVSGPYLSLRTFRQRALDLDDLVRAGTLTPASAQLVDAVVRARLAYVVAGGTGSGKTTLLAALLARVPADERIVIVEDATELRPRHPHVVSLESRLSNVEGSGAVGLRDLVRQALRMRPDRLVVGECRGAEVVDLLSALNTGHEGGACTLHANTAADVPARFEALGLLGGLTRDALHAQLVAGLQVVLQLAKGPAGAGRAMTAISVLLGERGGGVRVVPAWLRTSAPGCEGGATALAGLLAARGVPVPAALGVHP
jgi:pilus assembly protein CpaF